MKNRRIEGSLSKTINLGNYESMKVSVGLSYDINDKEVLKKCYDKLFEEIEIELHVRIKTLDL